MIGAQNVTVYPDNICDVVIPVAIKTIVPPDVVPEMLYGPACVKKYIGCNVNVYSVHPVLGVGDGVIVTLGVTVGVIEVLGVLVGVTEGVKEGVTDGVRDGDGFNVGVTDGVGVNVGV